MQPLALKNNYPVILGFHVLHLKKASFCVGVSLFCEGLSVCVVGLRIYSHLGKQ